MLEEQTGDWSQRIDFLCCMLGTLTPSPYFTKCSSFLDPNKKNLLPFYPCYTFQVIVLPPSSFTAWLHKTVHVCCCHTLTLCIHSTPYNLAAIPHYNQTALYGLSGIFHFPLYSHHPICSTVTQHAPDTPSGNPAELSSSSPSYDSLHSCSHQWLQLPRSFLPQR